MATAKKTTATKKPAAKKPAVKSTATKAKSTAVKKTTAPKKATAKTTPPKAVVKPAAKKTPAKRSTAAPVRRKATKSPDMQSFKLAREQQRFTEFSITRQTIYWIILVAFIVFVQLWILKLQVEVTTLLDARHAQVMEMM